MNSFEKSRKREALPDGQVEAIINAMIDEGFFKEHNGMLVP